MNRDTSSEAFFDSKYQAAGDPWLFATSAYEQNRYDATMGVLRGRRFRRVFEPGCSIGVLTERLATLADQVEALDISPTAVRRAAERCSLLPNVVVGQGALPSAIPEGQFDLIVMSEIGYYFDREALAVVAKRMVEGLEPGGVLLAVHWLGVSPDHLLSGDEVHEVLAETAGLARTFSERYDGFRIDRWTRR